MNTGILRLAANIAALRLTKRSKKFVSSPDLQAINFILAGTDADFGFVRSKANPGGLQAEFFKSTKDSAITECRWTNTGKTFQGFPGIIHGGILVALCDELMASALVNTERKFGMTLDGRVEWKRPARVGDEIRGRARVRAKLKNFRLIEAELFDSKAKLLVRTEATFYLPTWETFKRAVGGDVPEELRSHLR